MISFRPFLEEAIKTKSAALRDLARGGYIIRDGNHRTIARKMRGFTHIRGVVEND